MTPLTIENARVGMRVRFRDLTDGLFRVDKVDVGGKLIRIVDERGICGWYPTSRFVLAGGHTLSALLSERAPELLAALREWGTALKEYQEKHPIWHVAYPALHLLEVVSDAGLLAAPPSQEPSGVTDVQAQIREGWWV